MQSKIILVKGNEAKDRGIFSWIDFLENHMMQGSNTMRILRTVLLNSVLQISRVIKKKADREVKLNASLNFMRVIKIRDVGIIASE